MENVNEIRFASKTVITADLLRLHLPSDDARSNGAFKHDCEYFIKHKRHALIRSEIEGEFDEGFGLAFDKPELRASIMAKPQLWVFAWGGDACAFSAPVYRGKAFFEVATVNGVQIADVPSDNATYLLLADMFGRGGIDNEAFQAWRKSFLGALSRLNPVLPAMDGKVN